MLIFYCLFINFFVLMSFSIYCIIIIKVKVTHRICKSLFVWTRSHFHSFSHSRSHLHTLIHPQTWNDSETFHCCRRKYRWWISFARDFVTSETTMHITLHFLFYRLFFLCVTTNGSNPSRSLWTDIFVSLPYYLLCLCEQINTKQRRKDETKVKTNH